MWQLAASMAKAHENLRQYGGAQLAYMSESAAKQPQILWLAIGSSMAGSIGNNGEMAVYQPMKNKAYLNNRSSVMEKLNAAVAGNQPAMWRNGSSGKAVHR